MRVEELARDLGLSDEVLLGVLAGLADDAPSSAGAPVPSDLEDRLRAAIAAQQQAGLDPRTRQLGIDLILRAFDVARLAGKADWDRMSIAVLKNRILDLTGRAFDETQFGVASFRDWLGLFSEVLEVDWSRSPPWVRLIHADAVAAQVATATTPPATLPPRWRIRSDLWRAVVDVGAAGDWQWDGESASFRPHGSATPDPATVLPTLTAEDLVALRGSFVDTVSLPGVSREALHRWRDELLPDSVLPYAHRGQWTAHMKRSVLRRLRDWFEEHQLPEPSDLVEETSARRADVDPLDDLRALIIRCVRVMTRAELEEIRLPASVVLRATKQ